MSAFAQKNDSAHDICLRRLLRSRMKTEKEKFVKGLCFRLPCSYCSSPLRLKLTTANSAIMPVTGTITIGNSGIMTFRVTFNQSFDPATMLWFSPVHMSFAAVILISSPAI